MSRTWYKILTALLWLAPTAIGLRYWQVWDRLSLRVASHFDAAGHANGWMTRNVSLYYTVGFMGCLAAVFTVVLYVVQKKYALAKLSWALLVFLNVEIWTVAYAMNSILDFNLSGTPITIAPLPIVTGVGTLMIVDRSFGRETWHRARQHGSFGGRSSFGKSLGRDFYRSLGSSGGDLAADSERSCAADRGRGWSDHDCSVRDGLGWISLLLHPARSGDSHAGFPA